MLRFSICTAVGLVLAGCDLASDSSTVTVRGAVLDTATGDPVPYTHLALEPEGSLGSYAVLDTAWTDDDGRYQFEIEQDECDGAFAPFSLAVSLLAPYEPAPAYMRPEPICERGTQQIDVPLRRRSG